MLSTVSSATFILVLVLLLLNMAAGADDKTYSVLFFEFTLNTTNRNAEYTCYLGNGKRATLTEIQQKVTPTKVTCQPSNTGNLDCNFKDKVGCEEATDVCIKKLEGESFKSIFPGGDCPNVVP